MLFNSYEFILLFLPVTLWVFAQLGRRNWTEAALAWLAIASLGFYAWWNPPYLALFAFSIGFNYLVGSTLSHRDWLGFSRKLLLGFGIVVNLALIGYYKYANFFLSNVNTLLGSDWTLGSIILPLGISFFTFQQITYLIDAYNQETKEYNFVKYCLFVSFFPQLIAGPIVHHREVMPQFQDRSIYQLRDDNLSVGLTIFSLGLFKKVIFADSVAVYATPVFDMAAQGGTPAFGEAWCGALAYTLQLYFDFSGYSDMAMGAARLFGIRLPLNFHSPYKAVSMIDFWRRWHITLSRFLRDYLYIPLGGNRKGELRRYFNLFVTMLLGGLWHGAGWTFVLWGGLHGSYLVINHGWRSLLKKLGVDLKRPHPVAQGCGWALTFGAVVVGWVLFRAANLEAALLILKAMFGSNGISLPASFEPVLGFLQAWGVQFAGLQGPTKLPSQSAIAWIGGLLIVAWYFPNTQEWLAKYRPALDFPSRPGEGRLSGVWRRLRWRPTLGWSLVMSGLAAYSILSLAKPTEFLYFQF